MNGARRERERKRLLGSSILRFYADAHLSSYESVSSFLISYFSQYMMERCELQYCKSKFKPYTINTHQIAIVLQLTVIFVHWLRKYHELEREISLTITCITFKRHCFAQQKINIGKLCYKNSNVYGWRDNL